MCVWGGSLHFGKGQVSLGFSSKFACRLSHFGNSIFSLLKHWSDLVNLFENIPKEITVWKHSQTIHYNNYRIWLAFFQSFLNSKAM